MIDPGSIRRSLALLRTRDPESSLFGAMAHQYQLNAPLVESDVQAFERRHGTRLPDDYRRFIATVGNGGAGPYYGVFRIGEHDHLRALCTWEAGGMVGTLSEPFPHMNAWNLPQSFWAERPDPPPGTPDEEEDAQNEAWDTRLEPLYWNPSVMNGAIPISNMGCALRCWLIVNGACRGQVWADYRADYRGLEPLMDATGARHTFETWYVSWLEAALKEFEVA
jgi:hypothetical protein